MFTMVSYMVFDVILYLNVHTSVSTRGALTLIDAWFNRELADMSNQTVALAPHIHFLLNSRQTVRWSQTAQVTRISQLK
jgi:hypothetical protein